MDRRVLGSGAIVCSAMVLWSQPSAPESQVNDCETEGDAACATDNSRQAQARILPATIDQAIASLPIQWGRESADRLPTSMERMYGDLLKQAQASANQSKFANALTMVAGIPNNSQHHQQAQQLQETWSQELLQRANDRAQQGDVEAALVMLNAIPATTQRFDRAAELRERWNQQAALLDQAQSAKERGDWQSVMSAIESLEGTPLYDSRPVQQLLQQAIYRAYRSDGSLMELTGTTTSSASAPALAAIPTDDRALPEAALPNLPDLPIDVTQAMEWAQPIAPTPSIAATPSTTRPPRPMATTPAVPEVPPMSGSITPPEAPAALSIQKIRAGGFTRQTMAERHSFDRKAIQ